jgi:hypothetical protein
MYLSKGCIQIVVTLTRIAAGKICPLEAGVKES